MRYDREHKQKTRARVVREAAAAIRSRGPGGVGIAALMGKLGLTHGGFYAHFKSKDDLVRAAIRHMFEDRVRVFCKCMADVTPAQGLGRYIDVYLSAQHRDQPARGCAVVALASDVARMTAAARLEFALGVQGMEDAVAGALQAMGHADPGPLAGSLVAEMVGAMAIARAVAKGPGSDQLLAAARSSVRARAGLG